MQREHLISTVFAFVLILHTRRAARLKGFEADLHLEKQQFATLLSILYVGYIIMQIPS